jgi:serine/threonine protein kinase
MIVALVVLHVASCQAEVNNGVRRVAHFEEVRVGVHGEPGRVPVRANGDANRQREIQTVPSGRTFFTPRVRAKRRNAPLHDEPGVRVSHRGGDVGRGGRLQEAIKSASPSASRASTGDTTAGEGGVGASQQAAALMRSLSQRAISEKETESSDKVRVLPGSMLIGTRPLGIPQERNFHMHKKSVPRSRLQVLFFVSCFIAALSFCCYRSIRNQWHLFASSLQRWTVNTRQWCRIVTTKAPSNGSLNENYVVGAMLGAGSVAIVYKARSRASEVDVAVKMLDLSTTDKEEAKAEVDIMKLMIDERLTVGCIDAFHDACFSYIVMPLFLGGDLLDALTRHTKYNGKLDERSAMRLLMPMAEAVNYVHSKNVVHCDIKPDNFLLKTADLFSCDIALADFGLSKHLWSNKYLYDKCGTSCFFSPEVLTGGYRFERDTWALGLTAFVLLASEYAFWNEEQISEWVRTDDECPVPKGVTPEVESIFQRTLTRHRAQRVSAEELLVLLQELNLEDDPCATFDLTYFKATRRTRRARSDGLTLGSSSGSRTDSDSDGAKCKTSKSKTGTKTAISTETLRRTNGRSTRRRRVLRIPCKDMNVRMAPADLRRMQWMLEKQVGTPQESAEPSYVNAFTRNTPGGRIQYEWWSPAQRRKAKVAHSETNSATPTCSADTWQMQWLQKTGNDCEQLLRKVLHAYGIDMDRFGVDGSNTLERLATDCLSGKYTLCEESKHVVQVIDLVSLSLTDKNGHVLLMAPEDDSDAVDSSSSDLELVWGRGNEQLPSKRAFTWESKLDTAYQILNDVGIDQDEAVIGEEAHLYIHRFRSPLYPMFTTIVLYHEFRGQLKKVLQPRPQRFQSRTQQWMPASDLDVLKEEWPRPASHDEVVRYRGLSPLRVRGISLVDCFKMLRACAFDPATYDPGVLMDLCEDASIGLCDLSAKKTAVAPEDEAAAGGPASLSQLKRTVRIVVMRILNAKGDMLVEADFQRKTTNNKTYREDNTRLPAIKMRPLEHAFAAARRALTMDIGLESGSFRFQTHYEIVEENSNHKLYPGMITTYHKTIVSATLLEKT